MAILFKINDQISHLSPLIVLLITITLIVNNIPLAHSNATFYEILIEDLLPRNSVVMNVTCEVAGDDKYIAGDSIISGETMKFSYYFDPDHGVPANVSCTFVIGIKTVTFGLFDYNRDVVGGQCEDDICTWAAMEEGVYEYYGSLYHLVYTW